MSEPSEYVVITGGPCVGKTTLIKALRQNGHKVMPEVGTIVIRRGLEHPARNRHAFQASVLQRQLKMEARHAGETRFLDRGLLDGAAYYQIDALPVPADFDALDVSHYRVCFVLEPLGMFEHDGIRPQFEDLEFTERLTPLLENCYSERGIRTIRVPAMTVDERVKFVENACLSFNISPRK